MSEQSPSKKTFAVLVGLQLPAVTDEQHRLDLDELERLVHTLGFKTIARVSQKRKAQAAGSILGVGKLKELAYWTGGSGEISHFSKGSKEVSSEEDDHEETLEPEDAPENLATIVVVNGEISPTQLKNLEDATGVEVMDRTGVILEIFSRHANSRESRMQVEIAKLAYMAPRLRQSNVGGDRQGGGIAGGKGAGETAHELDRRRIRDRIAELKRQLKAIRAEQITRRDKRREDPSVALVGYTNAGKSSLMRALTSSEVLVADKLFATLGTTVRAMQPELVPRILISDTVGFIKNLPHDLVASFHSTLDEALTASLLFYTVDASDPSFRSQLAVTREVIGEIDAGSIPTRLILNKADKLTDEEKATLKEEFPDAIFISTKIPEDIKRVKDLIREFFQSDMEDQDYLVPYEHGKALGAIRSKAQVLKEMHLDEGTRLTVRAHSDVHAWIKKMLAELISAEKS